MTTISFQDFLASYPYFFYVKTLSKAWKRYENVYNWPADYYWFSTFSGPGRYLSGLINSLLLPDFYHNLPLCSPCFAQFVCFFDIVKAKGGPNDWL